MKNTNHIQPRSQRGRSHLKSLYKTTVILFLTMISTCYYSQDNNSRDKLLEQYINKDGKEKIVFSDKNIKQFWTSSSVIIKDRKITVLLQQNSDKSYESDLFKIQLKNVLGTMDCKVDVIADSNDLLFSICTTKKKELSSSKNSENFIDLNVFTSTFHLKDTEDSAFFIKFTSKKSPEVNISRIVLSFPNNQNYVSSQILNVTHDNSRFSNISDSKAVDSNSFSITGKRSIVTSNEKIMIQDKPVYQTVKIYNSGDTAARIYLGFAVYSKNNVLLDESDYPYKDNSALKILTINKETNSIVVEGQNEWKNGCSLAINAKEDMSDLPNKGLSVEKIIDVKKNKDGTSEIFFEKSIPNGLEIGKKIRIHGPPGAYLYTSIKDIQPKEEAILSGEIIKDEKSVKLSSKSLPKGVDVRVYHHCIFQRCFPCWLQSLP